MLKLILIRISENELLIIEQPKPIRYFKYFSEFYIDNHFRDSTLNKSVLSYFYKHKSSSAFINFFIMNSIDIPLDLVFIKSFRRSINQLHISKFINLLMKNGCKEKYISLVFKTLKMFFGNQRYTLAHLPFFNVKN